MEYLADGKFPEHLLLENQRETEENVGLFTASTKGNASEVLKWIKKGGKPNYFYRPEEQKNSLHVAAENGFLEVVQTLLNHGAVVDCRAGSNQATALILAATNTSVEVVKCLLDAGAHVEVENGYGNTALHEACREGRVGIVKLLLEHKANARSINHKGSSPLHMFCYGDSQISHPIEIAQLLIDAGSDVNLADKRGATPLLVACASGREDMVELLMKNGADPKHKDMQGMDAAAVAKFYSHPHLLVTLNKH